MFKEGWRVKELAQGTISYIMTDFSRDLTENGTYNYATTFVPDPVYLPISWPISLPFRCLTVRRLTSLAHHANTLFSTHTRSDFKQVQ